ncbi:hypothetical protein AVEN_218322-1 [Araneus ventricosus]|uniref:Uncharacterized protein n=1 Tax=Araneus ventricosus TaxID=182803 RepID=A0A4Y2GYN3_ARAVE|nr:hypothetical protein AVEN_218322-1 [Araneus ventricosus]
MKKDIYESLKSLGLYNLKITFPVFQSQPNGYKQAATTDEPMLSSSSHRRQRMPFPGSALLQLQQIRRRGVSSTELHGGGDGISREKDQTATTCKILPQDK